MQDIFPKCPICGAASGYEMSGLLTKYAKRQMCSAKWQLVMKEKQISELILHELPKDGSSVYTVASTRTPLFAYVGMPLPIGSWKNMGLEKEINWEFLSKNVSPDVVNAVIVEEGEKLLHQWSGTREIRGTKVVSGNTVGTADQEPGTLVLSTRKLRWLAKRSEGFWKQVTSMIVVHEIPLEEIRGISGGTGDSSHWRFVTKTSVVDGKRENVFLLCQAFLEVFKPIVENAIMIRRKEIDEEKMKERLHVMLDFSFLKTYMEKGGIVMQVLKCPECGGTVEFPKSGNETKCSHCRKTIYAQDVFEKLKSLLD